MAAAFRCSGATRRSRHARNTLRIACETSRACADLWRRTCGSNRAHEPARWTPFSASRTARCAPCSPAARQRGLSPAPGRLRRPLSDAERRDAGALMRVNHVGEVCAQALYTAQALATRDPALREHFEGRRARKPTTWPGRGTGSTNWAPARPLLNPLWYAGRFRPRPGRGPAGRPAQPGLRGRNRAPGGSAPATATWSACRRPTTRSRAIVDADEGRRGAPRRRRPCERRRRGTAGAGARR